jgi:hypothetical protein
MMLPATPSGQKTKEPTPPQDCRKFVPVFRESCSQLRDLPTIETSGLVWSDSQGHDLKLPSGDRLRGLDFVDGYRPKPSVGILPRFVPNLLPSISKNLGDLARGALPDSFLVPDPGDWVRRSFLSITVGPFGTIVHRLRGQLPPTLASLLRDVGVPADSFCLKFGAEVDELLCGPVCTSFQLVLPGLGVAFGLSSTIHSPDETSSCDYFLSARGVESSEMYA